MDPDPATLYTVGVTSVACPPGVVAAGVAVAVGERKMKPPAGEPLAPKRKSGVGAASWNLGRRGGNVACGVYKQTVVYAPSRAWCVRISLRF